MNRILVNDSLNPWHNLAVEELLFDAVNDLSFTAPTLFLWQNQNTIVIGRHQNAWRECRIDLLDSEGGRLSRRTTGGGAVFHDIGNLNFSFVMPKEMYDLHRQLSVITGALRSLGVNAHFTGRNDIALESGSKFSGNAFRYSRTAALHHGTIMVDVEMDKLSRYLVPSKEKLSTHAVDSVRSRVENIRAVVPSLDIPTVRDALRLAFIKEYGEAATMTEAELDGEKLRAVESRHESWDWRLGAAPKFDVSYEKRFSWGGLSLHFSAENARVTNCAVYSDAMNESFIAALKPVFTGARLMPDELASRVEPLIPEYAEAQDVFDWIKSNFA